MSKIIIANFKMNGSSDFFSSWILDFKNKYLSENKIILAIPYVYLSEFNNCGLTVAAQNVSSKKDGAYTSQVSAKMLKDNQVKYCIIGHSESRKFHQESDADVKEKFNELIDNEITPIICIGECQQVRDSKRVASFIQSQLSFYKSFNKEIIFAYEPMWAIGTGKHARNEDINEVVEIIRAEFDQNVEILYGGSVNQKNSQDLLENTDINGLLVGGASLNPKEFANIAQL